VVEVARLLKVPASWVYERCRDGAAYPLPHLKLGKYLRFRKLEILAYMENQRRGDLKVANRKA
jgi:predicted DNA-binding transcriptional regulator AlpA